ncbi:MAG: ubiquinol-cytochrome c reductase iron-sulfur subunit [Gemmatimonadota bacterium]
MDENARSSAAPAEAADAARRGFLKLASGVLGALVGVLLAIPLVGALLGPSFRRRMAPFAQVASVDSLPVGTPVTLSLAVPSTDAFLRKTDVHEVIALRNSATDVVAYSPICPHLGCHVAWDPKTGHFECPCHGSVFAPDGKVLAGPSPRPLDTLPIRIEQGMLAVRWEVFRVGIARKIPV